MKTHLVTAADKAMAVAVFSSERIFITVKSYPELVYCDIVTRWEDLIELKLSKASGLGTWLRLDQLWLFILPDQESHTHARWWWPETVETQRWKNPIFNFEFLFQEFKHRFSFPTGLQMVRYQWIYQVSVIIPDMFQYTTGGNQQQIRPTPPTYRTSVCLIWSSTAERRYVQHVSIFWKNVDKPALLRFCICQTEPK